MSDYEIPNFELHVLLRHYWRKNPDAKPHTARKTSKMFEELDGVEVLPHPAYSSDVAPSNYGLFRSMQHSMKGRRFESFDEVEEACQEFFDSKPKGWYFDQIRRLADR